jgi:hypothetical protein
VLQAVSVNAENVPAAGVPVPIAAGDAHVEPRSCETFKFGTTVVLVMANGAVPIASVEVIWPVALIVVCAADPGVLPPIAPGAAHVLPKSCEALRLVTAVVLATTNGAVPVVTVEVICPLALMVVNAPAAATVPPIAGGEAKRAVMPAPLTVLVAESVVNAPAAAVVPPIAPGEAHVCPSNWETFRFGTTVVLVIAKGAVPIAKVDVICPVAETVPKATFGVPLIALAVMTPPPVGPSVDPAPIRSAWPVLVLPVTAENAVPPLEAATN